MPILLDLTSLRVSPAYRRLFTGFTLAGVGSQLTIVAIGLQVRSRSGAKTVGVMAAAIALGSIVPMLFSGRLGQQRRQGLAVVVCVALWGVSVSGFGLAVDSAGTGLTRSSALCRGCLVPRLRPCRRRPRRLGLGVSWHLGWPLAGSHHDCRFRSRQ